MFHFVFNVPKASFWLGRNKNTQAKTVGFFVFVSNELSEAERVGVLAHERVHVRQNWQSGLLGGVLQYMKPKLQLKREAEAWVAGELAKLKHLKKQPTADWQQQLVEWLSKTGFKHYAFFEHTSLKQRKAAIKKELEKQI